MSASDAKLISQYDVVFITRMASIWNEQWANAPIECGVGCQKRVGHLSDNLILNVWINRTKAWGQINNFHIDWSERARWMNETNEWIACECRVFENDFIASNKMRWSLSVVSLSVMNLLSTQSDVYLHIPNACRLLHGIRPTCPGIHSNVAPNMQGHSAKWKPILINQMCALVCLETLLCARQRLPLPPKFYARTYDSVGGCGTVGGWRSRDDDGNVYGKLEFYMQSMSM